MHAYDFATARDIRQATSSDGAFLAGGTTLVDLMKLGVLRPDHVIDINSLPLRGIRTGRDGVRVGALERMSDLAADRTITGHYPVFAQALAVSASPQIRNMASIGGNLLQRTRCGYFRDVTTPCNKRQPGSGCPARIGDNREHAILGTSTACVATHASDAAVALMALDASVRLIGRDGERTVRLAEFYRLPGTTPDVENQLRPGELIAEVILPRLEWARTSTYVKVRDRQSYEFALCSAAVALDVRGHRIRDARVAAGGVGTMPWRLPNVETLLKGKPPTLEAFEAAARSAVDGAEPLEHNAFKLNLLKNTIVRALAGLR
ncbi:xanthine dehydrogenase YagS FAD-binding subunit [Amycolatopsis xylanica]|uniref:Xanthine dehydrogenase YagS FAD-binding subunit n=1 Tax=Amycolatopsis xylanica TaxID=589385 RepID=A0A1H3NNW9_9PSEU|nr:xanthine dehydrogenase family protein subunit M [Amycolatopsis xylanica]SDY90611.1 xanthine dehydrogenase YagS FAD-binding subunit [Amycolatopsis xylanica]